MNECKPPAGGRRSRGAAVLLHVTRQGLTLIHLLAQPEPFLTLNTSPKRLNTPSTPALDTPSTPPKHRLKTPCPTKSAHVELTGGRV